MESMRGDAIRAAIEYCIDLNEMDASLALTPLERLTPHEHARELIAAARNAGIQHYGFNPGLAEAVNRS